MHVAAAYPNERSMPATSRSARVLRAALLERSRRLALEVDDHERAVGRLEHLPEVIVAVVANARAESSPSSVQPPLDQRADVVAPPSTYSASALMAGGSVCRDAARSSSSSARSLARHAASAHAATSARVAGSGAKPGRERRTPARRASRA